MSKFIVISGPSGVGKTTIANYLQTIYNLKPSISITTRDLRKDEKGYISVSRESFEELIRGNKFLEWQEVYDGIYYGTLNSVIDEFIREGYNILFVLDVIGAVKIKDKYKDDSLLIFIQPPSLSVLEDRLRDRNTETEETIKKRLDRAKFEIEYGNNNFDIIITNNNLEDAIEEVSNKVLEFIKRDVL